MGDLAFLLKSILVACAAWDCRPTPTATAWWCSISTVPLWGSNGLTPTWPMPTNRRFSPVSTNCLCGRKMLLQGKVMCLPVPVWHCQVSSPMICDYWAHAISVGNVWISNSSMWSNDLILSPAMRPMPLRWRRFPAMLPNVKVRGRSSRPIRSSTCRPMWASAVR